MINILTLLFLMGSAALIGFIIGLKMRRAEKGEKVPQYVSENERIRKIYKFLDSEILSAERDLNGYKKEQLRDVKSYIFFLATEIKDLNDELKAKERRKK